MKSSFQYFYFLFFSLAFSRMAYSSNLTETFSCDTCDYQGAVELAESLYRPPSCNMLGLEDGRIALGMVTWECFSNPRKLIIANPLTRTAFKFIVSTEQNTVFSDTYNIIADARTFTSPETYALETFYSIDEHFRTAVVEVGATAVTSSTIQKKDSFYYPNAFTANGSDDSCDAHPANYLYSQSFRDNLRSSLKNKISAKIPYRTSWTRFLSSPTAVSGGGISISKDGLGIHVNLSRNNNDVFVSQMYGSPDNMINFRVSYEGSTYIGDHSLHYTPPFDIDYGPERILKLKFELLGGSSRIEGSPMHIFNRANINYHDMEISSCMKKILEENAESNRRIDINGDGTGTVVSGSGILVDQPGGNPGSLIPLPGIYHNLAGCHIVELVTTVEYPDGATSSSVTARWIEC